MEYARLGRAHEQLAAVVAPATPQSLRIINDGQHNRVLPFLGRVRLVRFMIYVAGILLVAFVVSAMNAEFQEDEGVFGGTGLTEFFNALELLAAAGLGAVFYGPYKANRFITNGSYDPKYEASYWIRFTLGIVGGILLAVVLDVGGDLTKPVLALLGGFAARGGLQDPGSVRRDAQDPRRRLGPGEPGRRCPTAGIDRPPATPPARSPACWRGAGGGSERRRVRHRQGGVGAVVGASPVATPPVAARITTGGCTRRVVSAVR